MLTDAAEITLEASRRDLASVKAVLVINGKITDPNVVQSFRDNEKNEEMLQQHRVFGDQPGLIVKVRRVMCAVRASHARRSRLSGVSSRLRPRHHRRTLQHIMFAMWGDKSVGGGCYLFESLADIETYLSSDFWETASADFPWVDVTYEAYEIGV